MLRAYDGPNFSTGCGGIHSAGLLPPTGGVPPGLERPGAVGGVAGTGGWKIILGAGTFGAGETQSGSDVEASENAARGGRGDRAARAGRRRP